METVSPQRHALKRDSRQKLQQGKFWLDMKKNFTLTGLVQHQKGAQRGWRISTLGNVQNSPMQRIEGFHLALESDMLKAGGQIRDLKMLLLP